MSDTAGISTKRMPAKKVERANGHTNRGRGRPLEAAQTNAAHATSALKGKTRTTEKSTLECYCLLRPLSTHFDRPDIDANIDVNSCAVQAPVRDVKSGIILVRSDGSHIHGWLWRDACLRA